MKKKGIKNKISRLVLSAMMVIGLFATVGAAVKVSAASDPTNAPSDWAFTAESVELNDAIVANYPAIDTNGDGFISISEAQNWAGSGFNLENKNINGTLTGIEYVTNLRVLNLSGNNLTGEIPSTISNLIYLEELYLYTNQITGSIPSTLGDITTLKFVKLRGNALTGEIPTSLGNLSNLRILELKTNQLTGQIPSSFGNLTQLTSLTLSNNNLTGGIPSTFVNLTNLNIFEISNNPSLNINKLKEQPSILADSLTQGDINLANNDLSNMPPNVTQGDRISTLQPVIDNAQILLNNKIDAEDKTGELLNVNKDNLNGLITINEIDEAQDAVNLLPDSAIKTTLQADINLAKNMLDAKDKVDGLLTTPDLSNLKPGVNAAIIEDAQQAVNKLPVGELKDELQAKINIAKNLLDAENKVGSLFNPDGELAAGIDQNKINEAQDAVNKLPNGISKDILQSLIDLAQSKLNEVTKNTQINKAPSVSTNVVDGKNMVNTNDSTNVLLLSVILTSAGLLVFVLNKRNKIE